MAHFSNVAVDTDRMMLWQVLALTSLVQCQLEAASIYTTWMEGTSYSKFTKVPPPLQFIVSGMRCS